jgi:hypothetical protein
MTDGWISEGMIRGCITISPGNPQRNLKPALKIETSGPHQEIYLRGDQVRSLLDFLTKHQEAVNAVMAEN